MCAVTHAHTHKMCKHSGDTCAHVSMLVINPIAIIIDDDNCNDISRSIIL